MTNQTIDDEEINNEENNALPLQSTHLQLERISILHLF